VLNETGVKPPSARKEAKPALAVPTYIETVISRNGKAKATFDAFSPSAKREYVEWIAEAKTDATREKRLARAIE
jgi:uncharacterized protein YdeI (YjbR/CyaY-like superfamily)